MLVIDEDDTRFYAAPSRIPGAGRGLFARQALRVGDRLAVVGVRVRRDSEADRCTAFADEYKVRAGSHLIIPCGMAALANHSAEPNLQKVMDAESVFLELLRDVEAGEELCFTYSDYARTRYGLA
jgi:hypothetical protein